MAATATANQAILTRLEAMTQYHPANAKLFDAWMLDPGDIVTVQTGTDENDQPITYKVPVFEMNVEWKGGAQVDIGSSGSEKRPPLSELKRRSYGYSRQLEEQEEEIRNRVTNGQFQSYVVQTDRKLGLVVSGTDENPSVNTASIILAINGGTGHSSAVIEADHIQLDGNTTLNGALNITGGELHSVYPISTTSYLKGTSLTLSDGSYAQSLNAKTLVDIVSGTYIVDASASGNVLTLTKANGGTVTFSKATTLRGGFGSGTQADPYHFWQSGVYKVQADPQGNTTQSSLTTTGHWGVTADNEDDKTYYGSVKATIDTGATLYDTGKTFEVNASNIWLDGYNAGGGGQITQPTISAVWSTQQTGLLQIDTTPTAATNPTDIWFSRGTVTWDTDPSSPAFNWATVPIATSSSQSGQAQNQFTVSVDASGRYSAGQAAANAAVTLTKTWGTGANAGRLTVSNSANANVQTVVLSAGSATWSGANATIPVYDSGTQVTTFTATAPLDTPNPVTPGASQIVVSPTSGIGLTQVTVRAVPITAQKTAHPTTSVQTISPNSGDTGLASVKVQKLSSISGSASITSNGTYTYKAMYEDADSNEQETGLSKTIEVNVPGGSVTGVSGTAVTNCAYDSTAGRWFGDTNITVTLSGGAQSTHTARINVQDPINVGAGAGWADAAGAVVWPGQGSDATFTMTVPDSTWGTTDPRTFTLSQSGSNAICKLNGVTVGSCPVSGGGSATVTGFSVTSITASNPTSGAMFNIAVKVNLSNGNTGTITIPVNTDWDNSTWVDGSTTIEYYKKIGSVSGPLIISSGGKQAARKLTISAPHADSVNVIAAGYRVHYTGVSSGQAASEIIAS